MKQVIMEVRLRAPEGVVLNDKDISFMSFGGYIFMVGGKKIPFDFEGCIATIVMDENRYGIEMNTYECGFFDCVDIDAAAFSHDYDEIGIHPKDITAGFLASATAIVDFLFTICLDGENEESEETQIFSDGFVIESIRFADENGDVYSVDEKLLGRTISQTIGKNNDGRHGNVK